MMKEHSVKKWDSICKTGFSLCRGGHWMMGGGQSKGAQSWGDGGTTQALQDRVAHAQEGAAEARSDLLQSQAIGQPTSACAASLIPHWQKERRLGQRPAQRSWTSRLKSLSLRFFI